MMIEGFPLSGFSGFLPGLEAAEGWHGRINLPLPYAEIFRTDTTSAGIYQLAAGQADPQSPHEEDEVYFVLGGRGALIADGERIEVEAGTWAAVPARQDHRFVDIAEDLVVLVVFSPPHPPSA